LAEIDRQEQAAMFGLLFLLVYRLVASLAFLMPRERGAALRARWALTFSSMTDGGLDDDFAEEVYILVRDRPELLRELEQQLHGNGWSMMRRRMLIDTIRQTLPSGRPSLF
jgi:hypothetical protein